MPVAAFVGTSLLAIFDQLSVRGWATAVLAIAVAVLVAVLGIHDRVLQPRRERLQQRLHERDEAVAALEKASAQGFWPPPPVRDVDPFDASIGVSVSAIAGAASDERQPPYVERDVDGSLDRAIATRRFIVLAGDTKVGKSRTAFEAVRRCRPGSPLLVPRRDATKPLHDLAAGLEALEPDHEVRVALASPLTPPVLWLDEVAEFLARGDLDRATLDRVEQLCPGAVAIATVSHRQRAELDDLADRELDALLRLPGSLEVEVDGRLSDAERSRATQLYPGVADEPGLADGLAEYFAALPALFRRYRRSEDQPAGRAVVRAALAWRRAGMRGPILEDDLRTLAIRQLAEARRDLSLTDDAFATAIAWATTPLASTVALLDRVDVGGVPAYRVPDHVGDYIDERQGAPSAPAEALDLALSRAQPMDALRVAVAAERAGRPQAATDLLEALAASDDEAAPEAQLRLLRLLEAEDPQRAAEHYRRQMRRAAGEVAGEAARRLGQLLLSRGDHDEGREVLRHAIGHGSPATRARAGLLLGEDLARVGDHRGALEALEGALSIEDPAVTPEAALLAGDLHLAAGEPSAAAGAWTRALGAARSDIAARAAARIGRLHLEQRRPDDAARILERAGDDPSGEALAVRADAWLSLRRWQATLDDGRAAAQYAQRILDDPSSHDVVRAAAGHAAAAAHRSVSLALIKLGHVGDAHAWAERGVERSPRDPVAWETLSRSALAANDLQRARQAAVRSRALDPEGPTGARAVGEVALADQQLGPARSYAEVAVGHHPNDPVSWHLLGRVHQRAHQDDAAFVALSAVLHLDPEQIEYYHPDVSLEWVGELALKRRRRAALPEVLPEVAEDLLAAATSFRRSRLGWTLVPVAMLLSLAVDLARGGMTSANEVADRAATVTGLVILAVPLVWIIGRQAKAWSHWQRVPSAWRRLLVLAHAQSHATNRWLPVGYVVVGLFGATQLLPPHPEGLLVYPGVGAGMVLAAAAKLTAWVRLPRAGASPDEWLDEERRRRRATSWVGPAAGVYLITAGGTLVGAMVGGPPGLPVELLALAGALTAGGLFLVVRWWLARRAIYTVPEGGTRRRMTPAERVLLEHDVLLRRAQSHRLPLVGVLLLFAAAVGVTESVAGDEDLWLTVVLAVGVGVWLLARWWNARRLLRSVEAGTDAPSSAQVSS